MAQNDVSKTEENKLELIRKVRSRTRICIFSKITEISEGTSEVWFDIPNDDFVFLPGQYVRLTNSRLSPKVSRGISRDFSITSTPSFPTTKSFSIAFRNSDSAFKKNLIGSKPGDEFTLQGPLGVLTLPEDESQNVILIASGIGITPFISVIRNVSVDDLNHRFIHLVYADSKDERFAYLEELNELSEKIPNIIVTKHIGRLSISDLKNYATFDRDMLWYLCGPSEFVLDFSKSIPHELHINAESIRTEEYVGYDATNQEYAVGNPVRKELASFTDQDLRNPQNLKALMDSVGQGALFSITDRQGSILYINEKFIEVSKYSLNEIIGQNHRILKSGYHTPAYYESIWSNISQGKEWRGEIKNKSKDGSFYWVDTTITPILDAKNVPEYYMAVRFLITDKKELEESRKEAIKNLEVLNFERNDFAKLNQRFDLATKSARIGVWEWDVVNNVLLWDDRMYKLYGVKEENFSGAYEAWQAELHPDDKKRGDEAIQKALKGEKEFDISFRVVWPDNSIHYIKASAVVERDDKGVPLKMVGINFDITAEKAAEENLRGERDRVTTILQSIGDGVFVIDDKFNLVIVNQIAADLAGVDKEDVIGRPYKEVFCFENESDNSLNETFILDTIKLKKTQSMASNTVLIQKNGEKIQVSDSAAPLLDNDGKVTGVVVVFRDSTKEYEVDRAKTEFVSLASHQLKTPVGAVKWDTQMLLAGDYGALNSEQKEVVSEIQDLNMRMSELVSTFLNISRIELGTFVMESVKTEYTAISDDVLNELKERIAQKNHTVTKSYQKNMPEMMADPKLLRIIFQNLLSNAIKYTPNRGKVGISIGVNKNNIEIAVSNNGLPIPAEEQPKIFTKLFRANDAQNMEPDGNGLGLYLLKSIVEKAGGKVWFESSKGSDTVFNVTFPLPGMTKTENL